MKKTLLSLLLLLIFSNFSMALLPTPVNYSPSSGSTELYPSVSLNWYSVAGATSYEIKFGTSPTLTAFALNTTTSTNSTINNLLFSTTYYWSVRAKSATDSSAWSTTWSFGTLSNPSLYSPSTGSTGLYPSVTLDWTGVTGANTYQVEIDTSATYNSPVYATYSTTSSYSEKTVSNLLFGKKYYWRVRAAHAADTSSWSASWYFTTMSTPSLYSPSTGSTGMYPSVTLDWTGVTGANTYQVEIDTSALYNSPIYATYSTTSSYSEKTVSNLLFGKKYYWRIRAAHAADTSSWSASWYFTTMSTPSLYSPSSGSTGMYPSVLLDWTGVSGANTYQVEVDTSALYNSPIYATYSTTSSYSEKTVSNLLFGKKYYWRIRAAHVADTSSWSASWNFTVTNMLTLYSPSTGSTGMYPSVLLDWTGVSGANTYQVEVDTSALYNSPVYATYSTTSSYSEKTVSNLLFGKKYYWRIRAAHAADTSSWSASWNFTVTDMLTLYSPTTNSLFNSTDITIDWNGVTGATNYDYLCDTNNLFNSALLRSGITTSSYSEVSLNDLSFGKTWYWKVRARHSADTSAWSQIWSFSINNSPTLSSPANNSIGISLNPAIQWNTFSGITTYRYQYDTDPLFGNPVAGYTSSGTTQKALSNLSYGTTYYWKVQAMHTNDTSAWSSVWNFTTLYQMTSGPVLISPASGSLNIAIPVNLEWNTISGALVYQYQLDVNSTFANAISGNTTQLTASVPSLMGGTIYYWRVRANNGSGYSPWSTTWVFTTQINIDIPQLQSPSNNSASQALNLNLDWNDVSTATSYEYQYSSSNTFATYITGNTTQSQTQISGLSPNTTYYWRVKASNGTNYSAWSNVWSFTTLELLLAPQLVSPLNMSINLPLTVTLDWDNVTNATAYEYQYSLDANFNPAINGSTTISQHDITGLLSNTQYYWKIRATDGSSFSDWSPAWSFTTVLILLPPTLTYPTNNAINIPINVTLNWDDVSNASAYEYQYSTDATFNNAAIYTVTPSEAQMSNLIYNTTYFWRVRSNLNIVISNWSATYNFKTINDVGIDHNQLENLSVYPNPVSDILTVSMPDVDNKTKDVALYNIRGKLIYQKKTNASSMQINVHDFAEGIYFLKIITADNKWTKKICIEK